MNALTIAWMETIRVIRERSVLFWMLLFPVLYAGLFGLIRFEESRSAKLGLCVASGDTGFLGRAVRTSLQTFADEMLDSVALATYGRADQLLLSDVPPSDTIPSGCARLLVIPTGLTDSVLAHRTGRLTLHDESQPDPAAFAAQALAWRAVLENTARYAVAVMRDSCDVQAHFDSLAHLPPRVMVTSSFVGGVVGAPSGFTQTVPGTMVMMVFMILSTHGAATFVEERRRGLLAHLATTPASRRDIIAGKLVGRLLIGGVQIAILWLLAVFAQHLLGLWIGYRLVETLPLLFVYGFAAAAIGLCMAAAARTVDVAIGVGVAVTLVMAALGGCWWPLEIVPRAMQVVGHVFPTAWAMSGLHQLMAYNHGLAAALPQMGILAAYGLGFTILATRLLRTA